MFSSQSGQTNLSSQASSQEALKQGMEPVLFAGSIAGDGHKDIPAHQGRKNYRRSRFGKEPRAGFEFDSIEQRDAHQKLLDLSSLSREDFLRKILEDIAL